MQAFAYLDIEHPPVAWAAMRGVIVAPGALREPSSFVSFMFAGIVQSQNNARLYNETIIEHIRSERFSTSTSRMRGMYFFESRSAAQIVIDQRWGGHFKTENLVELDLINDGPLTRVDANWITEAARDQSGLLVFDNLDWVNDYWAGRPKGRTPTWEIISNGYAIIIERTIREKAYEIVKRTFPHSWIFMEMSRLAGEAGSDAGLIMPYIIKQEATRHRLGYLLDDHEFHNPKVIAKMADHPDAPRLGARMRQQENWIVPDFRPWFREFNLSSRPTPSKNEFPTFSVHVPPAPHLKEPTAQHSDRAHKSRPV